MPTDNPIREDWRSECGSVRLILGDCLAVLPLLEAGSVDAVVTDPEYGINAPKMTLGKGKREFHRGDWDREPSPVAWLLGVGAHHCFWGGNYFADQLPPTNDWLIWHKKNDGRSFSECEMAWTDFGSQVRHLAHHWGGEDKVHPTQKPLAVMLWTLKKCPDGCETILDPFAGSGTTGVAAVRTGRKFIGIEIDSKYFAIAKRRIQAELDRFPLFPEPQDALNQMELPL